LNLQLIKSFSVGPIVSAILGLILLPVLSWSFSVEDIGRFSIMLSLSSLVIMVITIGLDQAYVREYHEENNKNALFKTCFIPSLIFFCIISIPALILSIPELIFDYDKHIINILCIVSLFFILVIRFSGNILRMQGRGIAFSINQISQKLIFLPLVVIWISIGYISNFTSLLGLFFISVGITCFIAIFNVHPVIQGIFHSNFDLKLFKKICLYSWPIVLSGLSFWVLTSIDRFFLKSFVSYEELGVYSMSVSFAAGALILQSIFSIVWAPFIYKIISEEEDENSTPTILNAVRYVVFIGISMWLILSMLSPLIPLFLPEEYSQIHFLFLLSLSYPMLYLLSEVCGIGLGITRKTKYILYASLTALCVNLILNIYLIPLFQATGAAIASAISFLTFLFIKVEAASLMWVSIARLGMYFMVIFILIVGIALNVLKLEYEYVVLIYMLILIFWIVKCRDLIDLPVIYRLLRSLK
jgi:O-antigen/teichoic acid export membrane protein